MSVKASVDFVGVAPVLDQHHNVAGAKAKVPRHPPFALKGPVNRGPPLQVQAYHPPQLGGRQNLRRLLPGQIDDRPGTHLERVWFADRDAEGLIAAAGARIKHARQMLHGRVEEANYRPFGPDHAAAGANHPGAEDGGQIIEGCGRMRGTGEMRQHPAPSAGQRARQFHRGGSNGAGLDLTVSSNAASSRSWYSNITLASAARW